MKRLLYILVAAMMFFSCSSDDKKVAPDDKDPIENPDPADPGNPDEQNKIGLKVISFNILRYEGLTAWNARRDACVKMIETEDPDVIGFQEPIRSQIDYLAGELPQYAHIEIENNPGGSFNLFNVIMYKKDKFNLLDEGRYWLRPTYDSPGGASEWGDPSSHRSVVWAHLKDKATGKDFFFFCTHQSLVSMARLEGAKVSVERMKQIAGYSKPIFLVGDMNASNVATDSRKAELAPYNEWMFDAQSKSPVTDNKHSFNQLGEGTPLEQWRIDIIFYRMVKPLKYETLDGNYGVEYISDHYPVAFTCEF